MTIKCKKSILLIAPSPASRGGVSSVVNAIYHATELGEKFDFSWLVTQSDRNKLLKILTFAAAWLIAPWKIMRADLVHIHTSSYSSFFRKSFFMRWCILLKKKYIVHIHSGAFPEFMSKAAERQRAKRLQLLHKAAAIITLSDVFQNALCKYLPQEPSEKFFILPNPGRFDLQDPHCFQEKNTIFYCGWLEPEKGVYDLLTAFAQCQNPDWKLIMVGKDKHILVRQAAEKLNICSQLELREWQTAEQLTELYKTSTLLVLPSYAEGMPMVILEAMAFGLPVIATPVGAIPDMLPAGKEDFLTLPGDVKSLSKLLTDRLADRDKLEQWSIALQKQFAQKYTGRKVFEQYKNIYAELLQDMSPEK